MCTPGVFQCNSALPTPSRLFEQCFYLSVTWDDKQRACKEFRTPRRVRSGVGRCKSQWNNVGPQPNFDKLQNRELPEPLAGRPPSDDFSSLLNTCLTPEETRCRQRNCATDQTSCKWRCKSISPVNIPRIPRAGKCTKFNLLPATRDGATLMLQCVAGA